MPAVISLVSWRVRNDDGNEATATWKAAANTDVSLPLTSAVFRLRFEVQESGGTNDPNTFGYHVGTAKNGSGTYNNVDNSTGSPVDVVLALSGDAGVTDGMATTNQLTAGTGTFQAGQVDEDGGSFVGVGIGPNANQHTENEWVMALRPGDLAVGDTLLFRLWDSNSGTPVTGIALPVITVTAPPVTSGPGKPGMFDADLNSKMWF